MLYDILALLARWIVLGTVGKLPAKLVELWSHPSFSMWGLVRFWGLHTLT